MASSASADLTADQEILRIGNVLLKNPPSSAEEMLGLLDDAEVILSNMEQALPDSRKDALLPIMKALITDALFRSEHEEVAASVASCLAALMRISAPDAPYDDNIMEEIFQLMGKIFTRLAQPSGHCYEKAASTLFTVARVKACLLMLDLELHSLIIELFNNFLLTIEENSTEGICWSVEAIMTDILEESEGAPPTLLRPLISCLKKGNKRAAPVSSAMAERVICNCAAAIQSMLKEAAQLEGTSLNGYASTVTSIYRGKLTSLEPDHSNGLSEAEGGEGLAKHPGSPKSVQADKEDDSLKGSVIGEKRRISQTGTSMGSTKFEMELCTLPKKRSRKPNSLILPQEGYDHPRAGISVDAPKEKHRKRSTAGTASFLAEESVQQCSPPQSGKTMDVSAEGRRISFESQSVAVEPKKVGSAYSRGSIRISGGTSTRKIKLQRCVRKRKNDKIIDRQRPAASISAGQEMDANVPDGLHHLAKELVGQRIKVWWPKDKMFYNGIVHSFDLIRKKHKVIYTDGEVEFLNLKRQRWELIGNEESPKEQKAYVPEADPPRDLTPESVPRVVTLVELPPATAILPDDSGEDTVSDDNIYEIRMRTQEKRRLTSSVSDSESSETTLDNGTLQSHPRSGVNGKR